MEKTDLYIAPACLSRYNSQVSFAPRYRNDLVVRKLFSALLKHIVKSDDALGYHMVFHFIFYDSIEVNLVLTL